MDTNIQAEVPKTAENSGPQKGSLASPTSTTNQTSNKALKNASQAGRLTASESPLVSPNTDPSVIVLSIVFIVVALALAAFLLREQIMDLLGRKGKKK